MVKNRIRVVVTSREERLEIDELSKKVVNYDDDTGSEEEDG